MLIIFVNSQGVVHKEFVPDGKTVKVEIYKGVMDRLLKRIQRVRPAVFCSRDFLCCTIMRLPKKLQIFDPKNVTTPYHPPYSPDLSPPDYFLFPKLKKKSKRLHFADDAEIKEAVTDKLKKIQKEEFSTVFQKLYDHAKACIYANGTYFELKLKKCVFVMCLRLLKEMS
jgi:hypothetical protein